MFEAHATEHFDFGTSASDLLLGTEKKRNIKNEVSNKGFDPEAVIDAYEVAKGIKKRPTVTASDYLFKNIILDPEQQKDQDMLNELMNNKKYTIALWKDTWTPQGNFRVFIIYGTKQEPKKNDDKK